jgi:hypothetical protein
VCQALGRVKRRDGSSRDVPDPARLMQLNSQVQPQPIATTDTDPTRPEPIAIADSDPARLEPMAAADSKLQLGCSDFVQKSLMNQVHQNNIQKICLFCIQTQRMTALKFYFKGYHSGR